MPGRLFLTSPMAAVAKAVDRPWDLGDEPPRQNIAPGQEIVTLTPDGFQRMRWGLIPQGRKNARGRPVMEVLINARSETLFDKSAFEGLKRAVVPADGWYEWTGEKRKKTAWSLRRADGALLWFAAMYDVWSAPGGTLVPQVATVTCAPNADVEPIHHRMGVLLAPEDVPVWISGDEAQAKSLTRPLAEGILQISEASGVDWDGA